MTLPDGTSGPRAKCKFCHKDHATSTKETGHLKRHMYKCMPAHGQVVLKQKHLPQTIGQRSGPSSCTELIKYLEAQFDVVEDNEEFDLLLWWKTYTYRYPVLSHLARDVLVIPVSMVSSEQAFSTSGCIIEPKRSCLSPEMVEVLTCLQDWEHAKKRLQNLTVDKELILNFNNLYIDDPVGSGQGQN
ncbi:hypothetical protein Ddye_029743 [Dipteronia dyeriana]|uniref:BED-type domain-containing protein n=1 Tax=Dipteronia dyeriana TaxID=168575 RepID=A0AAD9WKY8_9ROSI|nr:hypothetical protein Ddye_029743 [Dipteronia dyeriana]